MEQRSRMVRIVKRGDALYIGPDVSLIVNSDAQNKMRLRFICSRHDPIVHEYGSGVKEDIITPDRARLPRHIRRGDVFYIGPDIVVKVENEPTFAVKLFISADRSLQIHHKKSAVMAYNGERHTDAGTRPARAG